MLIHRKLNKFLQRSRLTPSGRPKLTPIIITDSKGFNLQSQAFTSAEKDLTWYCMRGARIRNCREWIRESIDAIIEEEGNIWVYIWAGTCDFTAKNGKYISLRTHDTESIVEDFISEANLIIQCVNAHPGCKVTILEIPLYSIVSWNWAAGIGRDDRERFYDQEKQLGEQIIAVNRKIRELNEASESYSPKFSSDLLTLIQ